MTLRISINAKRIEGPYGGGNQFVRYLEKYMLAQGHEVFRTLVPRLDAILVIAAQKELRITAYNREAITNYRTLNPNTIVAQRINTCDEQRAANRGVNRAVLEMNQLADHTIFVSSFLRELYQRHGFDLADSHRVIMNGANEDIFNPNGRAERQRDAKFKIVTHHWSNNYLKGFDAYERLDQLLGTSPYQELFEFTFIGNLPFGVSLKNTQVHPPMNSLELAEALKECHFYITAARHEPGGNHFIEAMRCGLPVLYLRTGSLPEYCGPYGIEYSLIDFEDKLLEMCQQYTGLRERVLDCPYTAVRTAQQYEALFLDLVRQRQASLQPQPGFAPRVRHSARVGRRKLGRIRRVLNQLLEEVFSKG